MWQFAAVRARDALPSLESFKAIVLGKFGAVKLANCGGPPNKPLKRGRGGESDEREGTPTMKARVGEGCSQAVTREKRAALASGKPGNPGVTIPSPPPRHWPGADRNSSPTEMQKLLRLDMFRERVFEWFAPAGALCLALAELGLNTRDQSTYVSACHAGRRCRSQRDHDVACGARTQDATHPTTEQRSECGTYN